MKAVILAAGVGRRLGVDRPKCMIDVGGMSIIHRQLAALRAVGVEEFVIVVGFEQQQLRDHLVDQPGRITFVENPRYAQTNTIYSLYLARTHIDTTFFYTNADVVFDHRLPQRLLDAPDPITLAIDTAPCGEEEVKVSVEGNRITRIGKHLDPATCHGEFLGVAKVDVSFIPPFVKALEVCVEIESVVTAYFERAIDHLCNDWPFTAVSVSDLPCGEIDFPEDLAAATANIAPKLIPPTSS